MKKYNRLKIRYEELNIEFRGFVWAIIIILMVLTSRLPEIIEAITVLIKTLKSVGP